MPWPTPQDYQEAMQHPRIAFADPELKSGWAEEDQLGFPRPICGNFASVYKVITPNRVWAVRCFLKDFKDQQQRYSAISAQLKERLPFTVGFDFIKQGILVNGNWYPVLKMEWVQGESFIQFISNNLQFPQKLISLGQEVAMMARALFDSGIAHGDLQHGNILVVNGKPKLIDYDGMYVPALQGQGSHEVGHPNFQHPARKEHDFGPSIDNFSVWVIYLSLLALSVRPDLWRQFQGGDDCLLFRRKDFEEPDRSPVLRELERLPDPRVQALAARFRSSIPLGPLQIPQLDAHSSAKKEQPGSRTTVPDWIKDHVPNRGTTLPAGWLGNQSPQNKTVLGEIVTQPSGSNSPVRVQLPMPSSPVVPPSPPPQTTSVPEDSIIVAEIVKLPNLSEIQAKLNGLRVKCLLVAIFSVSIEFVIFCIIGLLFPHYLIGLFGFLVVSSLATIYFVWTRYSDQLAVLESIREEVMRRDGLTWERVRQLAAEARKEKKRLRQLEIWRRDEERRREEEARAKERKNERKKERQWKQAYRRALDQKKCPYCPDYLHYQYECKDGTPDLRYKNNRLVCRRCRKIY